MKLLEIISLINMDLESFETFICFYANLIHLIDIRVITNYDPFLSRTSTYNDRVSH